MTSTPVRPTARESELLAEIDRLRSERAASDRALTEALGQKSAAAEVLRVIRSSPADLPRALNAIVEMAQRLCESEAAGESVDAGIWSDLTAWCGDESHHDDMTVLVLRVPG